MGKRRGEAFSLDSSSSYPFLLLPLLHPRPNFFEPLIHSASPPVKEWGVLLRINLPSLAFFLFFPFPGANRVVSPMRKKVGISLLCLHFRALLLTLVRTQRYLDCAPLPPFFSDENGSDTTIFPTCANTIGTKTKIVRSGGRGGLTKVRLFLQELKRFGNL